MARKRNIDEILNETLPEPSRDVYNKRWEEFKKLYGDKSKPEEVDFLQYFDNFYIYRKAFQDFTSKCESLILKNR